MDTKLFLSKILPAQGNLFLAVRVPLPDGQAATLHEAFAPGDFDTLAERARQLRLLKHDIEISKATGADRNSIDAAEALVGTEDGVSEE